MVQLDILGPFYLSNSSQRNYIIVLDDCSRKVCTSKWSERKRSVDVLNVLEDWTTTTQGPLAAPASARCRRRGRAGRPGALARVEDGQPQRAVVVQQHRHVVGLDLLRPAVRALEREDADAGDRVVHAVADEVHHVVVLPSQHPLQGRQRAGRRGVDDDQVAPLQVGQRISQPGPLGVGVEGSQVGRAGGEHQHPQRRRSPRAGGRRRAGRDSGPAASTPRGRGTAAGPRSTGTPRARRQSSGTSDSRSRTRRPALRLSAWVMLVASVMRRSGVKSASYSSEPNRWTSVAVDDATEPRVARRGRPIRSRKFSSSRSFHGNRKSLGALGPLGADTTRARYVPSCPPRSRSRSKSR